jgi:hypothetical protein
MTIKCVVAGKAGKYMHYYYMHDAAAFRAMQHSCTRMRFTFPVGPYTT